MPEKTIDFNFYVYFSSNAIDEHKYSYFLADTASNFCSLRAIYILPVTYNIAVVKMFEHKINHTQTFCTLNTQMLQTLEN